MKTVRIGAGQAFYGDSIRPPIEMARKADVNYISFDALAELTLAILAKDRQKNPAHGYTKDLVPLMKGILGPATERGIKLITNAGALNPKGAAAAVAEVARSLGLKGLKIGVITGDEILPRLDELYSQGINLSDMNGGKSAAEVRDRLLFANAYLGAAPIARALSMGAHVVITGRTTDTALWLGPLLYEFQWAADDWDQIAGGLLMGHIVECTAQATGGNFSGRWWEVSEPWRIGYPIAEVQENGEFVVTKAEGTGGAVTFDTIKEQLLYEMHDPSNYMTPDAVVDVTDVRLTEVGKDRVLVTGAKGRPAPPTLKAVMGYSNGWLAEGRMMYAWPDAYPKAKAAAALLEQILKQTRFPALETHVEYMGINALHGPLAPEPASEPNEVMLRYVVRTEKMEDAARLGREIPYAGLAGPPHVSGVGGVIPPRELLGMVSVLLPRELIEERVEISVEEV